MKELMTLEEQQKAIDELSKQIDPYYFELLNQLLTDNTVLLKGAK